jgi:hypothetical protein
VVSTEGKTEARLWYTDDWGGYERVLPPEVTHVIGNENTQRLERTNGIVRQQTGRWHRRQNKFGKLWAQTKGERFEVTPDLNHWGTSQVLALGLRDAQDNKVPITIALIGALLRVGGASP